MRGVAGPAPRWPELVVGDACTYQIFYAGRVIRRRRLGDDDGFAVDFPGHPAQQCGRADLTHAVGGRDAVAKGLLAALAKAGRCAGLRILNLRGCNCGPEGAKHLGAALAVCPALAELDASDNHLGAAGALALAPHLRARPRGLAALRLASNDLCFGDDVVLDRAVRRRPGGRVASRMKAGTADASGVAALCEALEGHFTLELLDLSDNHLGVLDAPVDPAKWEAVDLGFSAYGYCSANAELVALAGDAKVRATFNQQSFSAHAYFSRTFDGLALAAPGARVPVGAGPVARLLARNVSLTACDLSSNFLGGARLDGAVSREGVELVAAADGAAAALLAGALARNDRLRTLDLADNGLGSDNALVVLRAAGKLAALDLSENGLDDAFADGGRGHDVARLGLLGNPAMSADAADRLAAAAGADVASLCGIDGAAARVACASAADRALLRFDLSRRAASGAAAPLDVDLGDDGAAEDAALASAALAPGVVGTLDGVLDASTLRLPTLVVLSLPAGLSGGGARVVAAALRAPGSLPALRRVVGDVARTCAAAACDDLAAAAVDPACRAAADKLRLLYCGVGGVSEVALPRWADPEPRVAALAKDVAAAAAAARAEIAGLEAPTAEAQQAIFEGHNARVLEGHGVTQVQFLAMLEAAGHLPMVAAAVRGDRTGCITHSSSSLP